MKLFIGFFSALLGGLCLWGGQLSAQAPANDAPCGAVTVTVGGGCVSGDNTNSTATEGLSTPSCWNGPPSNYSHSVWYSFVATDDSITINQGGAGTLATSGNIVIYRSSNNACNGALTEVGCGRGGGEADLTGLTIGNTYFIMIDGQGTAVGTFCMSAYETPPPPPPIGATCSNPRDLYPANDCNNVQGLQYDEQDNQILTDPNTGNDQGATVTAANVASGIDGTCTTDNDGTQAPYWIRFTATVTTAGGNYTRITNQGTCPQDYLILSGSCGSLTQVGCFANVAAGATINLTVTAGTTYYVMITNANGSTCTNRYACLTSSVPYVSPYDNCASALPVTAGVTYNLTNANTTADRNLCSGSMENNMWLYWTCPAGWVGPAYVHLYNQDCACGNGLQMSIYAASGSCPPNSNPTCLVSLNPNNDNDFYGNFTPTPGQTYYMTIDGYAGCSCNFDFTILNTPTLPVSFFNLWGRLTDEGIQLDWVVGKEINVASYRVMRSDDGMKFNQVGLSNPDGNVHASDEYISYSFMHNGAKRGLYRIEAVDFDGSRSASPVVEVASFGESLDGLRIFPVPADDHLFVELQRSQAGFLVYEIMDLTGRKIFEEQVFLQEGSVVRQIAVEGIAPGIYLLKVRDQATGKTATTRFNKR